MQTTINVANTTVNAQANTNNTTFVAKMHNICAQHVNNLTTANVVLMQALCACVLQNSKQQNTSVAALNARAYNYIKHYAAKNSIVLAVSTTKKRNTAVAQTQQAQAVTQSSIILTASSYSKRK